MRYVAVMIYAMIGAGVTMGIEKGQDRELGYPTRIVFMTTWPIAVAALSTNILIKDGKK